MNKTNQQSARVQRLENDARLEDNTAAAVFVDWDNTPDSKREPGTLVIEWNEKGEIISHRITGDGKQWQKQLKSA